MMFQRVCVGIIPKIKREKKYGKDEKVTVIDDHKFGEKRGHERFSGTDLPMIPPCRARINIKMHEKNENQWMQITHIRPSRDAPIRRQARVLST
jgi:hypothetical protein